MIYHYKNKNLKNPKVSVVLHDWSCRESFHSLHYLNNQTVPREHYEILWVEFFSRKAGELDELLGRYERSGSPSPFDSWIILEIPDHYYFHKHLLYNTGIVASHGQITVICDSDAMFSPNFIQTIISEFERDSNIVLHFDEVRNFNKKYYPFNYPSFEEVTGEGVWNWKDGKTTGLWDTKDPIHSRNYGACMCALRDDLTKIGGADEHIDFLGYSCGPYDMTFRLINAGKKEIWCHDELLYHTYHPGTVGENSYLGPHDGKHMAALAMEARRTGRIKPLLENRAINALRLQEVTKDTALPLLIDNERVLDWEIDEIKMNISNGRIAFYEGRHDEALELFTKALADSPSNPNFLGEMGWIRYYKGQYDEALKVFNMAFQSKSNEQLVYRGRGWVNMHLGNNKSAIADFEKAQQLTDNHEAQHLEETYRGRGWTYINIGDHEKAKSYFEKALEYADDASCIKNIKHGLELCSYREKGGYKSSVKAKNIYATIKYKTWEIYQSMKRIWRYISKPYV